MLLSNSTGNMNSLEVIGVLIDEMTEVVCATSDGLRLVGTDPYAEDLFGRMDEELSHATPHEVEVIAMNGLIALVESRGPKSSLREDPQSGFETKASQVLQAGCTHSGRRATDEEALQGYQSFKRYLKDHQSYPRHKTPSKADLGDGAFDEEAAAIDYAKALRGAGVHRAIFYTKDGHLGLGPECNQPGDVLAILYGCQWPVVMRPLPMPGDYTFLECAYVYGIMDGEAIRVHQELGREDDRFRII